MGPLQHEKGGREGGGGGFLHPVTNNALSLHAMGHSTDTVHQSSPFSVTKTGTENLSGMGSQAGVQIN